MTDKPNTGEIADAEQAQRAREAESRAAGDFAPIGGSVADFLGPLSRAREAWQRRKLSVLESDCPDCQVDSAAARVCSFRGQEFCRHVAELGRRGRLRTLEANMRRGKVPEDLWKPIVRGDFEHRVATAAARRIVAEEGKLAILAGGAGAGKSFGLALTIAERGGWFQSASDLDPFGAAVNELLEHCGEVSLLGLDDVGAGRSISDTARARVEQLVCMRWDRGLPTVITTNLTRSNFWPLYGGPMGRIADRVNSDPVGWVTCLEDSKRHNPQPFNERSEK